MRTIEYAIKNDVNALYYGNRVILPFVCDILKAVIEHDIITDFSSSHKGAEYHKHESFTEIYFHDYKDLPEVISKYETIKFVVVENGKDIFNFNDHEKIALRLMEKHKMKIDRLNNDDVLLID